MSISLSKSPDTSLSKKSFRHKGGSNQGKLVKGFIQDAFLKTNISCIPSKFETIIYNKPAKQAFGTSSTRFFKQGIQETRDLPGPGFYNKLESETNKTLHQSSSSYSQLGFGTGFTSKTSRNPFSFKYSNMGPGPGTYDSKTQSSFISNSTKISNITKDTTKSDNIVKKKLISPGPGEYNPKITIPNKETQTYYSSFFSKTKRDKYLELIHTPDPGTYEVRKNILKKIPFKHSGYSSSFIVPKPNLLKKGHQPRELLDFLKKSTNNKRIQEINSENKPIVPGPGFYDKPDLIGNLEENGNISWNFQDGIKTRFGDFYDSDNKIKKYCQIEFPGPGTYDNVPGIAHSELDKAEVTGSVFKSETVREPFGNLKNKLGPNQLVPYVLPKNKSYHLNLANRWI